MVPRKPRPGVHIPSAAATSSQASTSSSIPHASSSSQVIDLTSSPVKAEPSSSAASRLPSSSQSQIIDLSSSPVKASTSLRNEVSAQSPDEADRSPTQPGLIAEGRVIQAQREEDQEDSEGSPEPEDDVFFLRHLDEVVGIQHYPGLVGVGERVVLVSSRSPCHLIVDWNTDVCLLAETTEQPL